MGGGGGGNYGNANSSALVTNNLERLKREFRVTKSGYFGIRSSKRGVRQIKSNDPLDSGIRFFTILSRNALRTWKEPNGALRAYFSDGSHIVWRPKSHSDGSPAIRLQLGSSEYGVAQVQRIHFIKD